jgi:hypothetical protein
MATDKPRTLEQRLKFDLGLAIGEYHLVKFTLGERSVTALVEINRWGHVHYLKKPADDQMYSTWQRVKGDASIADGAVYVWAARERPELMARFVGEPVATVPMESHAKA